VPDCEQDLPDADFTPTRGRIENRPADIAHCRVSTSVSLRHSHSPRMLLSATARPYFRLARADFLEIFRLETPVCETAQMPDSSAKRTPRPDGARSSRTSLFLQERIEIPERHRRRPPTRLRQLEDPVDGHRQRARQRASTGDVGVDGVVGQDRWCSGAEIVPFGNKELNVPSGACAVVDVEMCSLTRTGVSAGNVGRVPVSEGGGTTLP